MNFTSCLLEDFVIFLWPSQNKYIYWLLWTLLKKVIDECSATSQVFWCCYQSLSNKVLLWTLFMKQNLRFGPFGPTIWAGEFRVIMITGKDSSLQDLCTSTYGHYCLFSHISIDCDNKSGFRTASLLGLLFFLNWQTHLT